MPTIADGELNHSAASVSAGVPKKPEASDVKLTTLR